MLIDSVSKKKKKERAIEKFMKEILINPLMKNDDIFYNFISTEYGA